jgi:hypothetical protein
MTIICEPDTGRPYPTASSRGGVGIEHERWKGDGWIALPQLPVVVRHHERERGSDPREVEPHLGRLVDLQDEIVDPI